MYCNMTLWIWALYLAVVIECRNNVRTLSEEDFNEAKASGETLSVYFYNSKVPDGNTLENILKTIQMSKNDLESHGIHLGAVNCDESRIKICQETDQLNQAVVFKGGEPFATVNGDNLQTLLELQTYMNHYGGLDKINEVMNKEEYKEIQKKYAGKKDLIVFYIPHMGSIEHLRMLDAALQLPKSYELYYTFNKDLFDDSNVAWVVDCATSQTDECQVTLKAANYNDRNFKEVVEKSASVTLLQGNAFPQTLKKMVNSGKDVIVLIAGARKLQDALTLAKQVTLAEDNKIQTLVVDGTKALHSDLQSRIQDDKIFGIVSPGTMGNPKYINIGFLENEDLDELLFAMSRQYENWVEEVKVIENHEEEEDSDRAIRPEEVLDDPMAFSLHHTRHVRDLYWFDYKTLPRLTDKTYEKVIHNEEYAVILFTLEFSPKALATLVTFAEIHKAYKGKSPLYRVECYNWPDICEKAGIYTTPRMFFYPAGTSERIEYKGIWDKLSMKDAILRYSSPTVIIVRKKEDILPYLPITTRSIVGLFETDYGTAEFRKAAKTLRKDFKFLELHGEMARFVAEEYQVEYADHRLLAFEHSFPKPKHGTFKTEQDILNFCEVTFAAPKLQELTIYSFVEVLRDAKPVLIYFWDRQNGSEHGYQTDLKDSIQDIAMQGLFTDKVVFTWMDSSPKKTGEFVLERYNYRSRLEKPIVAFFDKKSSVMLKSCAEGNCLNTALIAWLQDCIDGKIESNYALSTEEWTPRLAGYDFLEMMKEDGSYPTESVDHPYKNEVEEEEKARAFSGGRTVDDLAYKLKKDAADEKKHERKTLVVDHQKRQSHAIHTEF